jgi:class 3 adenylate cyclase
MPFKDFQITVVPDVPPTSKVIEQADYASALELFFQMAELGSHDGELGKRCLLLLTTCRNEWYTLSAMYAELRLWLYGTGGEHDSSSIRHALKALTGLRANSKRSSKQASRSVEQAALFLAEFANKRKLFYEEFGEIEKALKSNSEELWGRTTSRVFSEKYLSANYDLEDNAQFDGAVSDEGSEWLQILDLVHLTCRAFTSLFRNFLSNRIGLGERWPVSFPQAYEDTTSMLVLLGCSFKPMDESAIDDSIIGPGSPELYRHTLEEFLVFAESAIQSIGSFCESAFPSEIETLGSRAHLWFVPRALRRNTIAIGRSRYEIVDDKAILFFDINDSTAEESDAPLLKEAVQEFFAELESVLLSAGRLADRTLSLFTWNDARVAAFETVDDALEAACALYRRFDTPKYIGAKGIKGLRFGLSYGSVIAGIPGKRLLAHDVRVLGDHPILRNHIAEAARLFDVWKVAEKNEELATMLSGCDRNFGLVLSREAGRRLSRYASHLKGAPMSWDLKGFKVAEFYYLHLPSVVESDTSNMLSAFDQSTMNLPS